MKRKPSRRHSLAGAMGAIHHQKGYCQGQLWPDSFTPSLQRATSLSPLSRGRRDSVHRLPAGQRPGGVLDRAQDSPPRALPQIPAGSRLSPGSPPLPDARRGPAHPANDLAPLPGPAHSSRRDPAYLDSALVPPLEALFIPPQAPTPPEPAG